MGLFDSLKRDKKETESVEISSVMPIQNSETEESNEVISPIEEVITESTSESDVSEEALIEEYEDAVEAFEEDVAPIEDNRIASVGIKSYKDKKPVTHAIGTTKIYAIINQKGGVGKSTTAVNLSAALGELNKQVLLVDLDPQGNSTSGLGIDKGLLERCIYNVLLDDTPIEDVIIPDVCEGLDLIPATINLAGAEVELVSEMARENRLKDAVGSLRGKYDYILIDCPPSLGLLTVNSLVAADKLIIPIQTEFYALEGVTKLLDSMNRVKKMLNPSLDIFGIVMTMYDSRTNLSNQVVNEVRSFFGKTVFETMIPRTVKLSEAPSYGQPIIEYAPDNKGTEAYNELAREVIARG